MERKTENELVTAPDSILRIHKTKVSYNLLVFLLDAAGWEWEHIGEEGNTIRIYNRFYGGDFTFE